MDDEAIHSDADGVALSAGDAVNLLSLPEGMVDDLPAGEAAFLESLVGGRVVVEVSATDPADGMIHFVYLLGHHLRLAD